MSFQGQLELLRLLFTEALYDEHLSRVSRAAPWLAWEHGGTLHLAPAPLDHVCPEGQGFPWDSPHSLLSPKLPVGFEVLAELGAAARLAWAHLLSHLPSAVVHSRRLSIPLCPRWDQWPRHRNKVMGLSGCSLQGSRDVAWRGCTVSKSMLPRVMAGHRYKRGGWRGKLKSSLFWLRSTLSCPSARPWPLRDTLRRPLQGRTLCQPCVTVSLCFPTAP